MAGNDRKIQEVGKPTRPEPRRCAPPALGPLLRFRMESHRTGSPRDHGIPAGELVRAGAIALAEDRLGEAPPATVSPGHLALIETMWRMVYVLATLNREQLLDGGRADDLDELVAEAREVMKETMDEGPV